MDLNGKIAIVTGAGRGIGRAIAEKMVEYGAKVVVADLAVDTVVRVADELTQDGHEAEAIAVDVTRASSVDRMVRGTVARFGQVDILVNNAGILRDRTFLKMSIDDMRQVIDVHLMGSMYCSKAVWEIMREQSYGRIVFTTSSTGLYGNFGQTNYGAAKMAMVGMMNTLHLEGMKYDIRVNCLAPAAGTAMTEGLFPEPIFDLLSPESVSPGVVFLSSSDAPSRIVLAAGGGSFAVFKGFETEGINLHPDSLNPEGVAKNWHAISSEEGMNELQTGAEQTEKFARQAVKNLGIKLG